MSALERALVDLGRHLEWPAERDLVQTVGAELRGAVRLRPSGTRRRGRRTVLVAAAATVALAGGLMAVPSIRAAVVRLFALPGVEIRIEEPTAPSASPAASPPVSPVGIGEPVTLDEARAAAPFPILEAVTLGDPRAVYLVGADDRAIVTLEYRRGIFLSAFRPRPDEELISKLVGAEGTTVRSVVVGGEQGYWIPGEHTLLLVDDEGRIIEDQARTAGSTLLWTRGPVTLRLEGDLSRAAALRIARSVV